jgi:hypothetical protein
VTPANPCLFTFAPAQEGLHRITWSALVAGLPVTKTDFINARAFASAVSLADARDRLGFNTTINDERLRTIMAAATREVEKITGTLVPRLFTNDLIPGTYRDALRVPHGPIFMPPANPYTNGSVTSLASYYPSGPSWPAGGSSNELLVSPMPGVIRHVGLIPFWYGPWVATYTGGVAVIAEPITVAVLETIYDMYTPYRGLTADAQQAALDELTATPYYRLPSRALAALHGYEMPGFG